MCPFFRCGSHFDNAVGKHVAPPVCTLQHDFGLQLSREERHSQDRQLSRRSVLARSRNHLLLSALRDEEVRIRLCGTVNARNVVVDSQAYGCIFNLLQYVLWVDSDLVSYPRDIIESLIGSGKKIVTPHCVMEPGGRSYDLNSWRAKVESLGM